MSLGCQLTQDLRCKFPILASHIHEKPLVYLDNAATTQKPQSVIDAISHYYTHDNANIHRGVHTLSMRATDLYETGRKRVQQFIEAPSFQEIVFCRGTTEAINLVAQSFVKPRLKPGDAVIVTHMEHHANIVPWQMVCETQGAKVVAVAITDDGRIDLDDYQKKLNANPAFVALSHASNALGSIHPILDMVAMAKKVGVPVLVDGAQAAPHMPIDVTTLDCDFYAFSGHKMYGPTGIGVLYAKAEHLNEMVPYQGGGDMIATVSFDKSTYQEAPYKFEAGTPNIAGVVGLTAAIDFLESLGLAAVYEHERVLYLDARDKLEALPFVHLLGDRDNNCGILSFTLEGIHAHDIGTILDSQGIAVRTGHHCAMPVMQRYQVPATVRASLGVYNTLHDVDVLVQSLHECKRVLGV